MKANQKSQKVDKGGKKVEKKGTPPPEGGGRGLAGHSRYISFEMRRKAVKLYLEEGIPSPLVAQEMRIKPSTLFAWVKRYREEGEEGLRTIFHPERRRKRNGNLTAVQAKIVEVKQANPGFGVKRISQLLRRMFFVPASAETVRRTLHKKQLMPVVKRKPQRNPSKPRFFERSTPNQMWQSDIFPFHLSGQMAYLIGFIDDHSRYITGLGLYRSQTAENVLEVYRRGTGGGKGGGNGGEKLNCRNDGEVCDENGRVGNEWNELGGNGSLPCGVGSVVGEADGGAGLPGVGDHTQGIAAMAGACDGRDVAGVATSGGPGGRAGSGALAEGETAAGSQGNGTGGTASAVDEASGERECARGDAVKGKLSGPPQQEVTDEGEGVCGGDGAQAGGTDYSGAGGTDECLGSGNAVGGFAQDLLQVGTTGLGRDPGGTAGREGGAASCPARPGEGGVEAGTGRTAGQSGAPGANPESPGYAQERMGE